MGSGVSGSVKNGQLGIAGDLLNTADTAKGQAAQLWSMVQPGMQTALKYYEDVASGNPNKLYTAIAPAVDQIKAQTTATKQSIDNTMPRGGEKNLAKEVADITGTSNIGKAATGAYTGAFPALWQMGSQGTGLSINDIANAISGQGAAGGMYNNIANQQAQGKASMMNMFGQLGSAAAMGAGTAVCWIAEALWSPDAPEVTVLRYWLNEVWQHESVIGAAVIALYRRFGRRVASWVKRSPVVAAVFRPLFECGLRRAQRELSAMLAGR